MVALSSTTCSLPPGVVGIDSSNSEPVVVEATSSEVEIFLEAEMKLQHCNASFLSDFKSKVRLKLTLLRFFTGGGELLLLLSVVLLLKFNGGVVEPATIEAAIASNLTLIGGMAAAATHKIKDNANTD